MIEMAALRGAQDLISRIRHEHALDAQRRLAAWAAEAPSEVAAVMVVLAGMATEDGAVGRLVEVAGLSPDVHVVAARECHRLHPRRRGEPWVDRGERIYQRDKKRRYAREKGVA